MENIFHRDEMTQIVHPKDWTPEQILDHDGIFYLKDVVEPLEKKKKKVRKRARKIIEDDIDPWEEIGVRILWNYWVVRMTVFSRCYGAFTPARVSTIKTAWDANTMLHQRGLFYLTDVCKKIPFTAHQLRYQVKQRDRPRDEIGVYRDDEMGAYLVDMELFAKWLKEIWKGRWVA